MILQQYLRGAAVCLVFKGMEPGEVASKLYAYMRQQGIAFPTPGYAESARLWKQGLELAKRPGFCQSIEPRPLYEI